MKIIYSEKVEEPKDPKAIHVLPKKDTTSKEHYKRAVKTDKEISLSI